MVNGRLWPAPADCDIAAKSAAIWGTPTVTGTSSARRHLTRSGPPNQITLRLPKVPER
jgi:hypothetical protein